MRLTLLNLDQKNSRLKRLRRRAPEAAARIDEDTRLSWVFHDHALEGVVLSELELSRGVGREAGKDMSEQAILDSVTRLYEAIGVVRQDASGPAPIGLDYMKRVHVLVAPPTDINAGRYRKVEGPLGAYLHTSPSPKAISYRLRRVAAYLEEEAPSQHAVFAAANAHHQYMQVFPFDRLSGRAGRLMLNAMLLRAGYPPVVIHASERAVYYKALQTDDPEPLTKLISASLEATLDATQPRMKLLDHALAEAA